MPTSTAADLEHQLRSAEHRLYAIRMLVGLQPKATDQELGERLLQLVKLEDRVKLMRLA